jgi:hypothetical protein
LAEEPSRAGAARLYAGERSATRKVVLPGAVAFIRQLVKSGSIRAFDTVRDGA